MTTLQEIVGFVTEQVTHYGIHDVLVADHEFDKNIPEGMTFVFPRGAVVIDPTWFPTFWWNYINEDTTPDVGVRFIYPIPDLVFRVDENGHFDCLGGDGDNPIPGVVYHWWPTPKQVVVSEPLGTIQARGPFHMRSIPDKTSIKFPGLDSLINE